MALSPFTDERSTFAPEPLPSRPTRFLCLIALLCPILIFYGLLSRTLTGLPFNDDYNAVLMFLLKWHAASGWHQLTLLWTHQHNEYRLAFQNTLYALQYTFLGHVAMKPLTVLGDLLVLPLFALLWLIWRSFHLPLRYALPAFIPAAWILFQLQYASTLNCVMAPLQNVAVLVFTLAVFYFGTRPGTYSFSASMASLGLAVCSSGGGLFVGPVLCLCYLQRKAWRRLAIAAVLSVLLGFFYMHGKQIHEHDPHQGDLSSFLHQISLPYGAAFLGSIATKNNPLPAILFTLVLLGIFIWACISRLDKVNPGLYYATLFFFIQGLAVSCLRAPRGLVSALGSRYRINSAILTILVYFYLADKIRFDKLSRPLRLICIPVVGVVLVAFNLASDRAGNTLLVERRQKVQAGIRAWEKDPSPDFADTSRLSDEERRFRMYDPIEPTLSMALTQGIYRIPPPGASQ